LIGELKRHGFLVKLDTNGSNPEVLENLIETKEIDFISMDVKAPLDPFSYRRSTGLSIDLNAILRSIEILKRGKVEHEFRMTVVPGLHQKEDIKNLGSHLRAGHRFVLQNFNPENPLDPSFKNILPYDPKVLKEMEREVQKMV
jgi:pyruvate formate lyase activating enzyme